MEITILKTLIGERKIIMVGIERTRKLLRNSPQDSLESIADGDVPPYAFAHCGGMGKDDMPALFFHNDPVAPLLLFNEDANEMDCLTKENGEFDRDYYDTLQEEGAVLLEMSSRKFIELVKEELEAREEEAKDQPSSF